MTDITTSSDFSIQSLKLVTDKLNSKEVNIPQDIFFYDSYWAFPTIQEDGLLKCKLSEIFNSLGMLMVNKMTILLSANYEKYIALLADVSYYDLVSPTGTAKYSDFFKVLKYNKLNHKIYEKDTIYVHNDAHIVVISDKDMAMRVREIRGNK